MQSQNCSICRYCILALQSNILLYKGKRQYLLTIQLYKLADTGSICLLKQILPFSNNSLLGNKQFFSVIWSWYSRVSNSSFERLKNKKISWGSIVHKDGLGWPLQWAEVTKIITLRCLSGNYVRSIKIIQASSIQKLLLSGVYQVIM